MTKGITEYNTYSKKAKKKSREYAQSEAAALTNDFYNEYKLKVDSEFREREKDKKLNWIKDTLKLVRKSTPNDLYKVCRLEALQRLRKKLKYNKK